MTDNIDTATTRLTERFIRLIQLSPAFRNESDTLASFSW